MNDDELLDAVARAARDELESDPLDVRWDDVPGGDLSHEEIARLTSNIDEQALAQRADVAFAPVDDAFHDALAAAAVESYSTTTSTAPDNVVALPARRPATPWVFGIAASVMLALGVTLTTSLRSPDSTLPAYSAQLRGTAQARGDEDVQRVRSDQSFELLLTPATAVTDVPSVTLYRVGGDTLAALITSDLQIADSGAIRITAAADQLPLGTHTLHAIVTTGELPGTDSLLANPLPEHAQRVVVELEVIPQR